MALASTGQYQVEKGLIFSYPCRTEGGQIKVIEGIEHDEFGKQKFTVTHQELIEERATVKELGLL